MTSLFEKLDTVTLPEAEADTAVWGSWLARLAADNGIQADEMVLLLHADDGVIWGRLAGESLALSSDAYEAVNVKLRPQTIQQMRLFGDAGELLVWRRRDGFTGRVITMEADTAVGKDNTYDEAYLLWGEQTADAVNGFTLLRAGARELLHAPPGNGETAKMKVRHYIQYDEAGQAYIAVSRVLGLEWADVSKGGESNDF